jgi:hypothetical protein
MSTDFAYLPPLPPIAAAKVATPAAQLSSSRRDSLLLAMTILCMGITVLVWTIRLDLTDSQVFVSAAAAMTVVLPEAAFGLMRAVNRRR